MNKPFRTLAMGCVTVVSVSAILLGAAGPSAAYGKDGNLEVNEFGLFYNQYQSGCVFDLYGEDYSGNAVLRSTQRRPEHGATLALYKKQREARFKLAASLAGGTQACRRPVLRPRAGEYRPSAVSEPDQRMRTAPDGLS